MMDAILKTLQGDAARHRSEVAEFLRIPSVSADPAFAIEVERCAEWLAERFRDAGLDARVEPTGGHPVVLAEWRGAPGAPTVLVYGHYDVQPALRSDGWDSEPFEPVLGDEHVVARGATDDKGQLYCHLAGARAHLTAHGCLPVNLVFLVEGEEEVGSAHLGKFIDDHQELLACDAVVVSDTAQFAAGVPAITFGLRGLCYLEAELRGPAQDLHSGSFGGAVLNPANALCRLVASLQDADGRVTVDGFYDEVREPEAWERDMYAGLPFDDAALRVSLGVEELWGEPGYSVLERLWARPTLDVNGLVAGYTGEGAKTVLPAQASVKLSCRLVPDQDPARIADAVEAHLRAHCPPGCSLEVRRLHGARPVLVPADSAAMRAARRAVELGFGTAPVLIRAGGSIPVVETFQSVLGAPVVLMGLGRPDDGAHGPNERFHWQDLESGCRASAWLWTLLANGETP